jgi:hypothetical protein
MLAWQPKPDARFPGHPARAPFQHTAVAPLTPKEPAEFMASLEEDEIAAKAANSTDYAPE